VNGKLSPVVPEYKEEMWKEKHPTGLRGWMRVLGKGAEDYGKGISGLAGAAGSVADAFGKVVSAPINAATMALGLQERKADLAHKNESYERGKTREDWEFERNKGVHKHNMTRAEWEMERDKSLHERHKTKEDWEIERDRESHRSNMDTATQNREHAKQSHRLAMDKGEEDLAATKIRDSYIGREKDQAMEKAALDYLSATDQRGRLLEEDEQKRSMIKWNKVSMGIDMGAKVLDTLAGAGGKVLRSAVGLG
jgi:predicted GNAT family acetyltransferase